MDYELLRTLLHDTLRETLRQVKADPGRVSQYSADMQMVVLTNQVERLAKQQGHISDSAHLHAQQQSFVAQALWELIIQGVLVPNNAQSISQGWPFVSFTEHGEKAIFEDRPTPYNSTAFLAQFDSGGDEIDAIVIFYVKEALGCFRANRHTASTVMLGVASERLFDLLSDALPGALESDKERDALKKKTEGKSVMIRYKELRKRLDPKRNQLPPILRDHLDIFLVSIFNLIRQYRNDNGHPTGRIATRDEAYASLYVFPHYCMQMCQLIEHLVTHRRSLA